MNGYKRATTKVDWNLILLKEPLFFIENAPNIEIKPHYLAK